ncbi:MAG: hypothetical protein KA795_15655 [Burkholderiaceae bacterium]|nr:hypothetical protein [Burkholderiaceae bacterium]
MSSLPPSSSMPPVGSSVRDAHKAVVVARVKRQRERWQAGLAADAANAASAAATAAADVAESAARVAVARPVLTLPPEEFPRSVTMQLVMRHPALAIGAVALVLAIGPSRLARSASWLLPMLMRRY